MGPVQALQEQLSVLGELIRVDLIRRHGMETADTPVHADDLLNELIRTDPGVLGELRSAADPVDAVRVALDRHAESHPNGLAAIDRKLFRAICREWVSDNESADAAAQRANVHDQRRQGRAIADQLKRRVEDFQAAADKIQAHDEAVAEARELAEKARERARAKAAVEYHARRR